MTTRLQELSGRRVYAPDLDAFLVEAMCRAGMTGADARTVAQALVTTDTMGVHTHGSKQLRPLLMHLRSGRLKATAKGELVGEGAGWALFDGHDAMPIVTAHRAMRAAIDKAGSSGIAYAGVRHTSHFGAAGYYARMALSKDMIGLAVCNVDPCMTVPGAKGKVMGTNPIAFAAPAGEERPVFLDIATSTVAASKVFAAGFLGKAIPDNWLVDDDGVPTTDASTYPEQGALLPMAGHKGYGLALLIEILAGALTGAGMTSQIKSWITDVDHDTNQGHAFIAINVGALMPVEQFKRRMDWLIRDIKHAEKGKGSDRIYLPGEMEWENRDRALVEGMVLPDDVLDRLLGLAEDWSVDIGMLYGGSAKGGLS